MTAYALIAGAGARHSGVQGAMRYALQPALDGLARFADAAARAASGTGGSSKGDSPSAMQDVLHVVMLLW